MDIAFAPKELPSTGAVAVGVADDRTLLPALSLFDGDLVITLSRGEREAHPHQVGVLAERAVTEAIVAAVKEADGFGLLPAAGDLKRAG